MRMSAQVGEVRGKGSLVRCEGTWEGRRYLNGGYSPMKPRQAQMKEEGEKPTEDWPEG